MAITRRESAASHRSEDATDAAVSSPISALGFGPHLSTAIHTIRQETSGVALPLGVSAISLIERAVDTAFQLHYKTDGATVSLLHGDMAGRKLFSVSTYPARTIELRNRPSWQQIFAFALANVELLLKPRHALGTWFNDTQGVHVLDVVVCISDRAEALALGLCFDQLSIYDLEVLHVIPVPPPSREVEASRTGGRNA